jgi:hypothetical protein
LQNGFNIGNKGINIFLTKGKTTIMFDKIMRTNKGFILGVDMLPSTRKSCVATMMLDRGKNIPKPILHGLLAHASNDSAKKTADFYGWKTTGDSNACEDCATAKARQKNLKKTTETKSNLAGERLMIDISSIKGESFGGSKYWLLILDDCTDQCWSKFLTAKSHTAKVLVPFIKELKTKHDKTVKYIRCDNAGENKATDTACAKEGLGIQFEYTAPGTPQQNGRVERKFATLYGRVRSMMNHANLPLTIRKGVWTEAAATATNIDTFLVTNNKPVASYNAFHEKESPFVRHLRTFGEIGVVLNHAKKAIKGKLDNRGRHCMMLGYADNHAKDVYRMLNLETNRVLLTRDIIWLKKMYGAWKTTDADNTSDDESINDLELQATKAGRETDDLSIDDATESSDDGDDDEDEQPPTNDPVSPRVLRAMKKSRQSEHHQPSYTRSRDSHWRHQQP